VRTVPPAIVDSHCHLDFPQLKGDLDGVCERARAAGVHLMVTISTRVRRFQEVLEIAEGRDEVFCTVGTHPHNAGDEPDVNRHPRAHELWAWAQRHGLSVRDLALQFALAMPIDGCVLVGAADRKQLAAAIKSARRDIPPETWRELDEQFGVGCRVLGGK